VRDRRLIVALVAVALGAYGSMYGGVAAGGAHQRATGGATFSDTAGDVSGSDITSLTLTDDAARGRLTFALTVTGVQPATEISVYLDTDRSEATPRFWGTEVFMSWSQQPGDSPSWGVQRRNGSDWIRLDPSPTIGFTRVGNVLTWTMTRTDLGNPSGFNAYATAMDWNGIITTGEDVAPDSGFWSYDLATPPPTKAVAGKKLLVSWPVTRSDTGAPLAQATISGDPRIGGRLLPHTEQYARGSAHLSLVVPRNANGKLLQIRLTVSSGAQSTTTTTTLRIALR
jgi:hypothetical protein